MNSEKQIADYLQEQLTQCQRLLKTTQDECDRLLEYNRQLHGALVELSPNWPSFDGMPPQCEQYLRMLYKHKGVVVTKETMHTVMYSNRLETDTPDIKIVDVQICRLRKCLPPNSIDTCWGRGWMLTEVGYQWVKEKVEAYQKKMQPDREHQLYRT